MEGLTRAEEARLAGKERQALRDAVLRYSAKDSADLHDLRFGLTRIDGHPEGFRERCRYAESPTSLHA